MGGTRDLQRHILKGQREAVALAVLRYLHEGGQPAGDRPSEDLATLRALLWLEHEAALVLENLPRSFFSGTARHFLWLHSRNQKVRELIKT